MLGAGPKQGSCLARHCNNADGLLSSQPEGKDSGRLPLVVAFLVRVSTHTASRA